MSKSNQPVPRQSYNHHLKRQSMCFPVWYDDFALFPSKDKLVVFFLQDLMNRDGMSTVRDKTNDEWFMCAVESMSKSGIRPGVDS